MGLGKTFVALTVMWAIIKHCNCKGVIVCPSSLISNWVKEVSKWIGDFRVRPIVVRPGQENSDVIRSYRFFVVTTTCFLMLFNIHLQIYIM
jgi:SNF2 family DNA or RNA helicase